MCVCCLAHSRPKLRFISRAACNTCGKEPMKMICENISVQNGILYFAGQNTVELAKKYGTPLYLMDEDYIRKQCRTYKAAFQKYFDETALPLFAGKACCFKRMFAIMAEEGLGIDVVSPGELYTAVRAGFDVSDAYFHSNNKTDADIAFGMDSGVGYFVVDNIEEIKVIEREAALRGMRQKVLLRLTPGIDCHTFEAVLTGKVDSKFGSAIETGQAEEITLLTLAQPHVELVGFHCHVGSQIFTEDVFERTATVMLEFIAMMQKKHGYSAEQLDLGGGFGVRYVESDPYLDIDAKVSELAASIKADCKRLGIALPSFRMEPGRSIVGAAGMTLYTLGTVKRIPGYKNYVSIDGGMADNPRFALYKSSYTCYIANRMNEPAGFRASIVGRCCESGDIIQENVPVPETVGRNDTVAVCTTGAYNYSMASNYNRLNRPPIVMLRGGNESSVAVKRESLEDLIRNDV